MVEDASRKCRLPHHQQVVRFFTRLFLYDVTYAQRGHRWRESLLNTHTCVRMRSHVIGGCCCLLGQYSYTSARTTTTDERKYATLFVYKQTGKRVIALAVLEAVSMKHDTHAVEYSYCKLSGFLTFLRGLLQPNATF